MSKKASENLIDVLIRFNHSSVDENTLWDMFMNEVSVTIAGLVTAKEIEHLQIDERLLKNLEAAFDEWNECDEGLDIDDINKRLAEKKN